MAMILTIKLGQDCCSLWKHMEFWLWEIRNSILAINNEPKKTSQWHLILDLEKHRVPWSLSESRCSPCSYIRCPKYWMWIWASHNFSWWPYVPLRLKALASGCCLLEGLRRKAKKQIIHILQQNRTSREPYIIQISLQDFWEIRRTLSKIPRYYCPAELVFFSLSKGKKLLSCFII